MRPGTAEPPARAAFRVAADGVVAAYGGVPVLREVRLEVEAAEIVALLGPSGSGKTTLLRCIAGLVTPTAGRIDIGGVDVTAGRGVPPERRRVGMVFQDGALFPHLSVLENVRYGLPRGARRGERADELLRLVGLGDKATRMPGTLSGGEQQRVALARALAPEPAVVLLDEPFSSLDAALRLQLRGEVHDLLKRIGVTTILVTHDQQEALTFSDRVAVIRDGVIEQVGTPEDVYCRPSSAWVAGFVGEALLFDAEVDGAVALTEVGAVPVQPTGAGRGLVLVRPEQLALVPGDGGVVDVVEYHGAHTRYVVALPSGRGVAVQCQGSPSLGVGERVGVRFVADQGHLVSPGG